MRYFLTALGVIFGITVFLFLDYALPSKQTVRITNTYNRLTEVGANAIFFAAPDTGTVQSASDRRDVLFIDTVRPNGKVYVYRNEDTGWVWPPYFKYTSMDLQGRATDLRSTREAPRWVSVTSYGWRVPWLSIYPNAISVRPVEGPDVRPFNWGATVSLAVIGLLLALILRMWNQFRERMLEPAARSARHRRQAARGRLGRWIDRLFGRKDG